MMQGKPLVGVSCTDFSLVELLTSPLKQSGIIEKILPCCAVCEEIEKKLKNLSITVQYAGGEVGDEWGRHCDT